MRKGPRFARAAWTLCVPSDQPPKREKPQLTGVFELEQARHLPDAGTWETNETVHQALWGFCSPPGVSTVQAQLCEHCGASPELGLGGKLDCKTGYPSLIEHVYLN